jgi:hypothetical protein
MDTSSERIKVDLEFGFSKDSAPDALAILISGYYMFKAFESSPHRFRENYPEVFESGEKEMISEGLTPDEAAKQTIAALDQYFDLLGKMVYMLGYELAEVMEAPFPREEVHASRRITEDMADLDDEEVMSELTRILNTRSN